ncbi:hypothetical protein B0T24DRAFT_640226 [Lasiosphaeria ovina]|uniref:NmrA-like domain-containing protein n=1 Tax=Lasiosphaeria ovina TaxID=92902 RepID=A0AAE0JUN9_9PEZI|nr:hypothetical protein B0T24DRAFT_640226 [Lasiosphaeria ovina]
MPQQLRKITIVGATGGGVGSWILKGALEAGHTVSVVTRPESDISSIPSGVAAIHRAAYDDVAAVTALLKGQDVLVLAIGFMAMKAVQGHLITAAAAAGVPWIVPTEYGSQTVVTDPLELLNPIFAGKAAFRKQIEELGVAGWIGVVNNPWTEFSLRRGAPAFGIDIAARKATLYDGGNTKFNTTTYPKVGRTLAAVLALPDAELAKYRNAWLHASSFHVSQRDFLASVLKAAGESESDWVIEERSAEEVVAEAAKEPFDSRLLYATVARAGYGGDYNDKVVDYAALGIEQEDLDTVVKSVVDEIRSAPPPSA